MAVTKTPSGATTLADGDLSNGGGNSAAHTAVERTSTTVRLPMVGAVTLPPRRHLAWYAGIGILAAVEIIDWPVAAALAVGKALIDDRSNKTLEEFGKALDRATGHTAS